jgi:hypothetical protein
MDPTMRQYFLKSYKDGDFSEPQNPCAREKCWALGECTRQRRFPWDSQSNASE